MGGMPVVMTGSPLRISMIKGFGMPVPHAMCVVATRHGMHITHTHVFHAKQRTFA